MACNLARILVDIFDKRVLLIDTDPQCNATQFLLGDEKTSNSFYSPNVLVLLDLMSSRTKIWLNPVFLIPGQFHCI